MIRVLTSLTFLALLATAPLAWAGEQARYLFEIENTWSESSHPGAFPKEAHFSWFGGGTHNDQVVLWTVGEVASPAMVQMAETGFTTMLTEQIAFAIEQGDGFSVIDQRHWFCPDGENAPSCGPTSFEVTVDSDYPLTSLVSMLGPSPDWFVGVRSLSLRADDEWINQIDYELYPYDGGSRSGNVFALYGPENDPAESITLISEQSGQLITNQSLGRLLIRRIQNCDLDGDFVCDATDIDFLSAAVRDGDLVLDLDGDGATNEADRRVWVEQLIGTNFGDANLDALVSFPDFLALAEGFLQPGGWAQGDFDGSGITDFLDFLTQAEHFGVGSLEATIVPEPPGCVAWIGLMILSGGSLRRRQ